MSRIIGNRYVCRMETFVRAGADEIWAEDTGGPGPALVLLHSGVADSRLWDPVWPDLTGKFRVIRYDCRGYGRSPAATEKYTQLGDLLAVLDHFDVARAHPVGCSMGGGTAAEVALSEPQRVTSLVLLCPGFSGYAWPEEPDLDRDYDALAAAGDEDGILRLGLREWARAGSEPFVVDLMRSALRAEPSEERYQQKGKPVFDRLAELSVPTVIMVGDLDRPALIACNEEAARRIPGCQLITMPRVDHYPPVREPQKVTETIISHTKAAARRNG